MAKKRKRSPAVEQGSKPRLTPEQQRRRSQQVARNRQAAREYLAEYERAYSERVTAQKKARAAKRNREVFPRASAVTITQTDGTVTTAPAYQSPAALRKVAPERLPIPDEMRARILDRDGHACRYCGNDSGPFEMDHVTPVIKGGATAMSNLVTACGPCNQAKGAEIWKPNPLPRKQPSRTP